MSSRNEGGYSSAYVPFCGLAVVETLAGIENLTIDPFVRAFEEHPVHEVTHDRRDAIDQGHHVVEEALKSMR